MQPQTNQLSLPGFAQLPRAVPPSRSPRDRGGPDRLFFGLLLEADAALAARQLALRVQYKHRLKAWPRPTRLLHVSLFWLGDFGGLPEGLVDAATAAAATVEMPPFDIEFDRVTSFGRAVVMAGNDGVVGVRQLALGLGEALEKADFARGRGDHFNPHVTLIYDDVRVPDQLVRPPLRWKVREFTLIHSLVTKSRYIPLKSFELRG